MRFRRSPGRRLVVWTFAVLVTVVAIVHLTGVLDGPTRSRALDGYRATFVFVLEHEASCTFAIPDGCDQLKVVTHASMSTALPIDSDRQYSYVIRYEIIDADGEILRDEIYALRAQRRLTYDDDLGSLVPTGLYIDSELSPMGARVVMVPLAEFAGRARRLRIRLEDHDPAVADVGVRLLEPSNPPEYKLYYLWHRLSKSQRTRLTQFQLYGPEILDREEKEQLLRSRWVASAPVGIEGEHYRRRKLYLRERQSALAREESIDPDGVRVGPARDGVIAIPRSSRWTRLELRPRRSGDVFAEGARAEIEVRPLETAESRVATVALEGLRSVHLEETAGGQIVVRAPVEVMVSPAVLIDGVWRELPAVEAWLPTYRTEWGTPIDYEVVGDVPFRLEFRRHFTPGESGAIPATVSGEVLDDDGLVLVRHASILDLPPSRYDAAVGEDRAGRVSEPLRWHIDLPTGARTVRVTATAESVLVAAATRPPDLPRTVRVPQDRDPYDRRHDGFDERPPPRSWFLLHPSDVESRLERRQQVLLQVQSRPSRSADDGPTLAWIGLDPRGAPEVCTVLMPRHDRRDEQGEPASYRFWPLREDTQKFRFGGTPGGATSDVTLIHLARETSVFPLGLRVDDLLLFETDRVTPRVGSVSLGPIAPGLHSVSVEGTHNTRVFINHAQPIEPANRTGEPGYRRRTAAWLTDSLSLDWQHIAGSGDRLAIRFFFPVGPDVNRDPVRVRVHLEARRRRASFFPTWTPSVTELEVTPPELDPDDRPTGWILGDPPVPALELVSFIPIGADLDTGEVGIEIKRIDGEPVWVDVSVGTPTRSSRRARIFSEKPRAGSR